MIRYGLTWLWTITLMLGSVLSVSHAHTAADHNAHHHAAETVPVFSAVVSNTHPGHDHSVHRTHGGGDENKNDPSAPSCATCLAVLSEDQQGHVLAVSRADADKQPGADLFETLRPQDFATLVSDSGRAVTDCRSTSSYPTGFDTTSPTRAPPPPDIIKRKRLCSSL